PGPFGNQHVAVREEDDAPRVFEPVGYRLHLQGASLRPDEGLLAPRRRGETQHRKQYERTSSDHSRPPGLVPRPPYRTCTPRGGPGGNRRIACGSTRERVRAFRNAWGGGRRWLFVAAE